MPRRKQPQKPQRTVWVTFFRNCGSQFGSLSPPCDFVDDSWALGRRGTKTVPWSRPRAPWTSTGLNYHWFVLAFRWTLFFISTDICWMLDKRSHAFETTWEPKHKGDKTNKAETQRVETKTKPARLHRSPTYPATCLLWAMHTTWWREGWRQVDIVLSRQTYQSIHESIVDS